MKNITGNLSLGLNMAAVLLGFVLLLSNSLALGVGYLVLSAFCSLTLLMNYCRKCPHSMNDTCRHSWPGRIAKRLPYKKTAGYTLFELFSVFAAILLLVVMPLPYLIGAWLLLGLYLVLWVSGFLVLKLRVCPGCYNRWCVICPNRVK